MRTPRLALPLLALALLAGACGDDDEGGSTATTAASPATTAAPDASTTTAPVDDTTTTAPDEPDPRPAVQVIEITVTGGQPSGGPVGEEVPLGTEVSIQVTADAADEVHLHGYDLTAEVAPGQLGEITFTADIPGQFEVELEGSGTLLVELSVA